ncbi:unnamed protein product [Orchesella dallaii]|uniref:Uncharacterized protein n=1 Tax=Orchesella dallaii TaxID=48710 RepID=A0ABP1PLB8_9HEXA
MEEFFQKFIRQNPTVLLLDDKSKEFPPKSKILKSRTDINKTTPYRWTFICLIEEPRKKIRADKYLEELLKIGHGRLDRFILLGIDSYLHQFLRSPTIKRFSNIIGVSIDKKMIHHNRIFERRQRDCQSQVKVQATNSLGDVSWSSNKTESLNGYHFKISGTKFPPYLDYTFEYNGNRGKPMGVNYNIFNEASLKYNYTYSFNDPKDWKLTGQHLSNGTWDGVFGDVVYGRADIASVSTQTPARNGFADFVGPFGRAHLIFMIPYAETHVGKYAIFRSYTPQVWFCILSIFFIFVALTYNALKMSIISGISDIRAKTNNISPISLAFLISWSLSFEQATVRLTKGIRFLVIMWVAFVMIIGTGYRSNLAAYISFPTTEEIPKTFSQLSRDLTYKIWFDLSGMSAWTFFSTSTTPMIQSIRKRSIPIENTSQCVMRAFMNPSTVCVGWDLTLKIAASKNMSISSLNYPLYATTQPVIHGFFSFALEKHSIFTGAFQQIGQSLFEKGILHFWRNTMIKQYRSEGIKWVNSRKKSRLYRKLVDLGEQRGNKNKSKALSIENVEFIFLILLAGIFISFAVFCWEMWRMKRICRRRSYRHRPTRRIQVETSVISGQFIP